MLTVALCAKVQATSVREASTMSLDSLVPLFAASRGFTQVPRYKNSLTIPFHQSFGANTSLNNGTSLTIFSVSYICMSCLMMIAYAKYDHNGEAMM